MTAPPLHLPKRSEKAEEALCDDFVARLAGTSAVVRISQPRNTMQTLGIPDRRYRLFGVAFWWEVKAEGGRLRTEQYDFLVAELELGEPGGCGVLEDLVAYVTALRAPMLFAAARALGRRGRGCELGRELVDKWAVRSRSAARGKVRRRRVKR